MSDKVTKLREVFLTPGQPNPEAIAILQDMLERAQSGEVQAVAIAVVTEDGSTGGVFAHTDNWAKLIGSIQIINHRVIRSGEDL